MEASGSGAKKASLKALTRSLTNLIEDLREQKRLLITKEVFGDDILWNVFVNADPKLAARCRTLNKKWYSMLKSRKFIIENYQANAKRQGDVIVGVGDTPSHYNSQWFYKVDTEALEGCFLEIPRTISPFGHYNLIGSDHGNLCLRVTETSANARLMVWNPLTHDYKWIQDEAWPRRELPVNVEAYGYLKDGLDYRIVNVWRRSFGHGALFWSVYDSEVETWTLERTYDTDIRKLGPQSVVSDGVVFWIAWDHFCGGMPKCIVSFNLRWMEFHHGDIPAEAPTENNALARFMGGVAFLTYRDIGHSREVVVWSVYREGHDTLMWEKMFTVSDFAIPYTPSLLKGSSIISVLDCKSSFGPSNNSERSDLFLYILRHMRGAAELFYHNSWEEDVQTKSITIHSDGLYPVRKEPPKSD